MLTKYEGFKESLVDSGVIFLIGVELVNKRTVRFLVKIDIVLQSTGESYIWLTGKHNMGFLFKYEYYPLIIIWLPQTKKIIVKIILMWKDINNPTILNVWHLDLVIWNHEKWVVACHHNIIKP